MKHFRNLCKRLSNSININILTPINRVVDYLFFANSGLIANYAPYKVKTTMRFSLKHLLLLLIFAFNTGTIMAQAVAKEVFGSAVDHINCETIRFIHREAGRAEVANNMDCLSFESIYKSIPADEAATTGALCKNINDYKNKFKEDKPLDAQLNAVIAFANAKIGAKKRKGNVEDFKASLEKIKKDALDAAKGGNAAQTNKNTEDSKPSTDGKKDGQASSAADTTPAIQEPAGNATKPAHKTDWLGLLSLLVGLGALGLAYMAYSGMKKSQGESMHPVATTYGNKAVKDDAMMEIQRVEKHFNTEIAHLNKLIDDMLKTGPVVSSQAPAATPAPTEQETTSAFMHETQEMQPEQVEERQTEREIQADDETELVATPEDKVNANEPELIPDPEEEPYIEREIEMQMEPETLEETDHETEPATPVYETAAPNLFETIPTPSSDLFSAGTPRTEPIAQNPVAPLVPPLPQPVEERAEAEPFMPEKEYEDGEAVPFYKFVGLPNAEGYFDANSFTDDPGQDSIYELEMYEDVPDKAFFSIRSNADVIRRAIQNPKVYLAPCCTFTEDPTGKHAIVLVEEGMLRKENNKWIVYEKAKISFE